MLNPGVSIIVLLADIQMDYTLTINRDLTMLAVPSSIITSEGDTRHFYVEGDSVTLTFSNVTLDGAGAGGGITSEATLLTLEDAVIKYCESKAHGGAVGSTGDLIINGGELRNNVAAGSGGAIYCSGTVTVNDAVIQSNTAGN